MKDTAYFRSVMLEQLAAQGPNPIPQPAEYWRRNLSCVVGAVSMDETRECLDALDEAGLVQSGLDPVGVRRYSATAAGQAAAQA